MPTPPPTASASLETLKLDPGMPREGAEKAIAAALGKDRSDYSPYGNNLRGGTVEYADANGGVLEVIYKAGSPAPWVVNKDGVAEHYPPVDESVISSRFYRK